MSEWYVALSDEEVAQLLESWQQGPILKDELGDKPMRFLAEELVKRVQGVKIEVFANEHPPPHFRACYQGSTANFRIDDCSRINGSGAILRYEKNIVRWYLKEGGKKKVVKAWNDRRPSDCPVGKVET